MASLSDSGHFSVHSVSSSPPVTGSSSATPPLPPPPMSQQEMYAHAFQQQQAQAQYYAQQQQQQPQPQGVFYPQPPPPPSSYHSNPPTFPNTAAPIPSSPYSGSKHPSQSSAYPSHQPSQPSTLPTSSIYQQPPQPYQPSFSQLTQQQQQPQHQQPPQSHIPYPHPNSSTPPIPFSNLSHPFPNSSSSTSVASSSVGGVGVIGGASSSPNVVFIGDRCARLWGMLWHSDFKLRLSIPDSIIFCNGAFHSYLFSSLKHRGEIRKKKGPLSLEEIRMLLVEKAEKDPSNVTPYVGILQGHDSSLMPIPYTSLPRILRSIGSLPKEDRIAQASFAGVPQRNDQVDLYQVVRAYVHPLYGLRFLTTYRFDETSVVKHSISTQASRFSERYQVLDEERAFYDGQQSSSSSSYAPLPPVPDAVGRECDRMTLCVVEWLSRIHGIGVKTLVLEFIQDHVKKLLLHCVVEVVFQAEGHIETTTSLGVQLLERVDDRGEEKEDYGPANINGAGGGGGNGMSSYGHTSMFGSLSDDSSNPSSGGPPRPPSIRPSSAIVSARNGRHGRANNAASSSGLLASSASTATFSTTNGRPGSMSARSSNRPNSARPSGSSTSRPSSASVSSNPNHLDSLISSSNDIDTAFRNTQPPRGMVGHGSDPTGLGLPRSSRTKLNKEAANNGIHFSTLMQFETRVEMDERMSRGGVRPPASGGGSTSTSADGNTSNNNNPPGGRADFLLFHWRSQARSAQDEIVRLNEELETSSRRWHEKETQLMSLLHMEEKKVAQLATQNQTSQMENQSLKHELDSLRLSSTQTQLDLETQLSNLRKEVEVQGLVIQRLEETKRRNMDELLQLQSEKGSTSNDVKRLTSEKSELQRLKQRAEQELQIAEKVRDELLEKLETEEKFARNLAQQLDLMSDWDSFEDMRHLFQKASGLARNEGNRLKDVEALRAQVVKYTKDRGWQDKKIQLQRQAKSLKKSAMAQEGGGGGGGGIGGSGKMVAQIDPVPERRATDIIAERALNRMAH